MYVCVCVCVSESVCMCVCWCEFVCVSSLGNNNFHKKKQVVENPTIY